MNTWIYVFTTVLATAVGGWIGAYLGSKYRENKEAKDKEKIRSIPISALNIIKSYAGDSYRKAEGEFNNALSIAEKRTCIVALHKLGIPIGIPSNEIFNIREVKFVDAIVDGRQIEDMILQIRKGYCDNLFYIDPESYFASNFTLFAIRNVAKRYISQILAKSRVDTEKNVLVEPIEMGNNFTLGEFKVIQVFKEQIRDQNYFDTNGVPIKEKVDSLLKEIDLGLWDSYLTLNYEAYMSFKAQSQMVNLISLQMQKGK